jgi:hypothetical protein
LSQHNNYEEKERASKDHELEDSMLQYEASKLPGRKENEMSFVSSLSFSFLFSLNVQILGLHTINFLGRCMELN